MNTYKLFGFCLLLLLAVVPLSLGAPSLTFQEKLDLAIQRGNTVQTFQADITDDFPLAAAGGQINQVKLDSYMVALQQYEDTIFSLPNFIFNQNGATVEKLVVLHAQVDRISASNSALALRLSVVQRKPLVLGQPQLDEATRYVDRFMSLALFNYQSQKLVAGAAYVQADASYQNLVTRSRALVVQSQYAAVSAQFAADRFALVTRFRSLESSFSDLGRQARALGRVQDVAGLAALQSKAKVSAELTSRLVMLPAVADPVVPPVDTDVDDDGIVDSRDNCVNVSNANQVNLDADAFGDVCDSDKDGDGVLNDSDNCPLNANADQADTDADSVGNMCDSGLADPVVPPVDTDVDDDGIVDSRDNCVNVSNANQVNLDADAFGDVCDSDKDGDGVLNDSDNCPLNANADQADTDADSVGNMCDSGLTAHEQKLADLTTRLSNYDDDYDEYERKYERAKKDDDTSDENKYRNKLEDLLDDVENLQDDLDDLLNNVEDDDNNPQLEDDIADTMDDADRLHEDINDTLGINKSSSSEIDSSRSVNTPSARAVVLPSETTQLVELQTFSGTMPTVTIPTTAEKGWDGMRVYAWIGVGALLVVAVLMLLIAAIMRK